MNIQLTEELRIRGTADCWQLEKAAKRKDQIEWRPFKYYRTIAGAVGEACQRTIRLHPATSLSEALRAVDEITEKYAKILDKALDEHDSKGAA